MTSLVWRTPTGRVVAPDTLRQVWAAVSACPQTPLHELSARLFLSISQTDNALQILRAAGYIDSPRQAARARQVLVPFAFIPAEPSPDDGPGQDGDIDGIPQGGT
jgi:hypothetical protein